MEGRYLKRRMPVRKGLDDDALSMEEYWTRVNRAVTRLRHGNGAGNIPNHLRDSLPRQRDGGAQRAGRAGHDAPGNLRAAGEFRSADGARGIGRRRAYR